MHSLKIIIFLSNPIVIYILTFAYWVLAYKYEKGTLGDKIATMYLLMIGCGLVISYDLKNEFIGRVLKIQFSQNNFAYNLGIFLVVSIICIVYFEYKKRRGDMKCPSYVQ